MSYVSSNQFKPGEEVICISQYTDYEITLGKSYTVIRGGGHEDPEYCVVVGDDGKQLLVNHIAVHRLFERKHPLLKKGDQVYTDKTDISGCPFEPGKVYEVILYEFANGQILPTIEVETSWGRSHVNINYHSFRPLFTRVPRDLDADERLKLALEVTGCKTEEELKEYLRKE